MSGRCRCEASAAAPESVSDGGQKCRPKCQQKCSQQVTDTPGKMGAQVNCRQITLYAVLVIVFAVTASAAVYEQSKEENYHDHASNCSEEPANLTVRASQVVLSGKVLHLSGRRRGPDVSHVRVIHVYRGLGRVRGHVIKVRGLAGLGACAGWVPRGAVRVFILDRSGVRGTFDLAADPLRLNRDQLDRLNEASKGKDSVVTVGSTQCVWKPVVVGYVHRRDACDYF